MITEPTQQVRSEQPYIGIRTRVQMRNLPVTAPPLFLELLTWLEKQDITPCGAGFFRYLVMDRNEQMTLDVGFPVTHPIAGDGRIQAGTLPAGRYGSLIYTGTYASLAEVTDTLLDWGEKNGIQWQTSEDGMAWGARIEFYLNAESENNTPNSKTEVAILIAENNSDGH
jgi:effector-binding domain-containing protein